MSQELTRTAIDSTDVAAADTVKVDTAWSAVNDYDYDGQPIDELEVSTDDIGTGDAGEAVSREQ